MDGSAFPFAEAINETGFADAPGETPRRALSAPIALEENGGKRFLAAVPSEKPLRQLRHRLFRHSGRHTKCHIRCHTRDFL